VNCLNSASGNFSGLEYQGSQQDRVCDCDSSGGPRAREVYHPVMARATLLDQEPECYLCLTRLQQ
jgi:hypothetical protein